MTGGRECAPKRTRESASKVRTGCNTCKARRVKCDEAKPICRRCAIGNRECEYSIAPAAPASRNVITVYLPPVQSQPVLFVNDRSLDYFHRKLAATLDGHFDSKFWSELVLQLSHSEPSVRDAVSAISVLYQDVESSLRHPAGYVEANPEAQQKWNGAVRSLSARIQAQPNSNLVPLVCSLLFTCIEFLKGNIESALLHVRGGFNILAALVGNEDTGPDLGSHLSSNDLKAIKDQIVPMFTRLNILCCLTDRLNPPIYVPTPLDDFSHHDLNDSRRRLVETSDACIRFIRNASIKAVVFEIDMDDLIEQAKLQTRLDAWRSRLNELLERIKVDGKPVKQAAFNILMVHYKVIYIWLRACTTAGEMSTDAYDKDFAELVDHAEKVAHAEQATKPLQPLSFEMQILGPLYYAVLKCRHPVIRRRAMELLKLVPRRECLWNAHHAYVTAKRVIELEESHLNSQGLPDQASRIYGLPLPSDDSRIYKAGEIPFGIQSINQTIVSSPGYPGTVAIMFRTKPWGLLGEWKEVTEYIKL